MSDDLALLVARLEERVTAQGRELKLRSKLGKEAIEKANVANEKRLDNVNEFRQTLADQTRDFPTREVVDGLVKQLATQISTNEGVMSSLIARIASLEAKFYLGGAGLAVLMLIVQLVLNFRHGLP